MAREFIFFLAVMALIAAAGIWLLLAGLAARRTARTAAAWPTAAGRIIRSGIQAHQVEYDQAGQAQKRHRPVVHYTYEVAGQSYTGRRITFSDWNLNDSTGAIAGRYPLGAEVVVRYDARAPSKAVLEPVASGTFLRVGGGILLIVLGVGLAVFSLVREGVL